MRPPYMTIEEFLPGSELARIAELVANAAFADGSENVGGINRKVKKNLEMTAGKEYIEIVKTVERAVRANYELNHSIFPCAITKAIISKYEDGMGYGTHMDAAVTGFRSQAVALGRYGQNYVRNDFAMTIFLVAPDSYVGGELCIYTPAGRLTYKLSQGSAVVYPAGMLHAVAAVERGTRIAAVVWLQSMIHDHERRNLVTDMDRLARQVSANRVASPEAALAMNVAARALLRSAQV
jgi:PKHD-type hydroxylase